MWISCFGGSVLEKANLDIKQKIHTSADFYLNYQTI